MEGQWWTIWGSTMGKLSWELNIQGRTSTPQVDILSMFIFVFRLERSSCAGNIVCTTTSHEFTFYIHDKRPTFSPSLSRNKQTLFGIEHSMGKCPTISFAKLYISRNEICDEEKYGERERENKWQKKIKQRLGRSEIQIMTKTNLGIKISCITLII